MTYGERRRRRNDGKGKYIALLLPLCLLLIFAIGLIVKQKDKEQSDLQNPPQSTQTSDVHTESTQTSTTQSVGEPAETHTVPVSTTPIEAPTDGNGTTANAQSKHIYLRVNHEKQVELPLDFGAAAEYSISDDNVAYVAQDGMLTGLQKGSCTLTVKGSGKTLEIPVTVREMVIEDSCTYVDGILVANKTYSLPRDYDPGLLPVTEEAFKKLAADAKAQGLHIENSSDYRTYDFQKECYDSIVNGYSKEYADSISARPGHSEHQTGYTIDCNSIDNTFAETAEGKWLAKNCWKYGFIIRYPADKVDLTGYAYESWHIRYVGVEHAKEIMEQGICLEEYLDIDSAYQD